MQWNSVEIRPKKNGVYLVWCYDDMHYFASFSKSEKWHRFTHFMGPIDKNSNWGRSIQVKGWINPDEFKKILFPTPDSIDKDSK